MKIHQNSRYFWGSPRKFAYVSIKDDNWILFLDDFLEEGLHLLWVNFSVKKRKTSKIMKGGSIDPPPPTYLISKSLIPVGLIISSPRKKVYIKSICSELLENQFLLQQVFLIFGGRVTNDWTLIRSWWNWHEWAEILNEGGAGLV